MTETTTTITSVNVETGINEQVDSETNLQSITVETETGGAEVTTNVTTVEVTTEVKIVEVEATITTVEVVAEVGASYTGISVYDLWLQAGNTGTIEEFLASLQGEDGDPGSEIELQTSATHIQWRYVWAATWTDLIALSALEWPPWDAATDTKTVKRSNTDSTDGFLNDKLLEGVEGVVTTPKAGTVEIITGGDFASSSGWTVPSGWTISGGVATHGSNGTGALSRSITLVIGELCVFTYTISGLTTGNVTPTVNGIPMTTRSANGTYTEYFRATATSTTVQFVTTNTARLSIDNASIKLAYIEGGYTAKNTNAATAAYSQYSPPVILEGQGHTGSAVQSVKFRERVEPRNNTGWSSPTGSWKLDYSINNAAYANAVEYDSRVGGKWFVVYANNHSNSSPGTTRAMSIENTGTYSHIDFNFSGTTRAAISANSSGGMAVNITNGSFDIRGGNSNINFVYTMHYFDSVGAYISNNLTVTGRVTAGYSTRNPNNYLQSGGSVGFRYRYLNLSSYTITDEDHILYLDTTGANACQGTPTACNTYTTSATCNAHTAVGCGWSGGNCSDRWFEECESQSPCSKTTTSCSSASNDMDCYNQNTSYGGNCAWNSYSQDCSSFDEETCNANSGAGCSVNTATCVKSYYCNQWNGNESECNANSGDGCSYDSGNGICNGGSYQSCGGGGSCSSQSEETCESTSYFTNCSNSFTYYVCDGNYYTGGCGGGEFGTCGGTANCTNLTASGQSACEAEDGCDYTTGQAISMPSITTRNQSTIGPHLRFKRVAWSGNSVLTAYSGDEFEIDGVISTTYTFTAVGQKLDLHGAVMYAQCSEFNNNESGCITKSGCYFSSVCSGWSSQEDCEANSCSWDSGNNTCYGGTAGTCGGTYIKYRRWSNFNN